MSGNRIEAGKYEEIRSEAGVELLGYFLMEFIIVIIIIMAICLILNVSPYYMLLGGMIFLWVFFSILAIGFLVGVISLLCSKRKEARFLRIDYAKNSRFQVAYYLVEGQEYPCMTPKEGLFEEKLYQKERTYHVMLNRKMGRVFDRFSVTACVLGLLFCVTLSVVLGVGLGIL